MFLGAQLQFTCMVSRGQQSQQFSIYVLCCASHAFSVQALCNHLEDDVMSGLSDALLRLCAVFAGQWDGRLVQAPVLLTLQLQNKHLYWGEKKHSEHTAMCLHAHNKPYNSTVRSFKYCQRYYYHTESLYVSYFLPYISLYRYRNCILFSLVFHLV